MEDDGPDPEPLFKYERQPQLPFWGSVASIALGLILVAVLTAVVLSLTT